MNFGHVLNHLKLGGRASRAGWNGKGMWVSIVKGSLPKGAMTGPREDRPVTTTFRDAVAGDPLFETMRDEGYSIMSLNGVSAALFGSTVSPEGVVMPSIALRAADGSTIIGWLASQTDMLAEDWVLHPIPQ